MILILKGASALGGGLPWWLSNKESTCSTGEAGDLSSISGSGRSSGGGKWQPTPGFLPENHMDRSGGLQSIGLQRVGHDLATEHARSRRLSRPHKPRLASTHGPEHMGSVRWPSDAWARTPAPSPPLPCLQIVIPCS